MEEIILSYEVDQAPLEKARSVYVVSQSLKGRLGKKCLCSNTFPISDDPVFLTEFSGNTDLTPLSLLDDFNRRLEGAGFMGFYFAIGIEGINPQWYYKKYPNGQLIREYKIPFYNKRDFDGKSKDERKKMTEWETNHHEKIFGQFRNFVESLKFREYRPQYK